MSTGKEMTIDERLKYLSIVKRRYVKAGRRERSGLLNEMVNVTGYSRKYLIWLLGGSLRRQPRRGGRGCTYGVQVDEALRVIHEALDYICAERLTPSLVWMAQHLAQHGELVVDEQLLAQLGQISVSTVERHLRRLRQDEPRLPRRPPSNEKAVLRDIPMLRLPWNTQAPGHFEVDLVHHCGSSAKDLFMCTIQWIDVATGWSERRARLGRSQLVMEDAFRCILSRLPFPVLSIHPDNDSAFFNHHLVRFWGGLLPAVSLSRSRPYHKNDNPHVEQKNRTLVRAFFGDLRFDTVAHVLAANRLYDQMWVYYNLFQPVLHLEEKLVIREDDRPTRIVRRHDTARTPFDRLCATNAILPEHRAQLEALRAATNPRQLRQEILDGIDQLIALPSATPGTPESVFDTLAHSVVFENADQDRLDFAFRRTVTLDELG
jgi:hypothetical protein